MKTNNRLIRNTNFIRNLKGGMTYDSIKTECNNGTGKIPEDKLSFVIQIMQGVNGLYNDTNRERKEAFARLEQLRKRELLQMIRKN